MPAWWTDPGVDATKAYQIITNRFRIHGSQSEFYESEIIIQLALT